MPSFGSARPVGPWRAEFAVRRGTRSHPDGALVQELEIDVDGLRGHSEFFVIVDGVHAGILRTDGYGGGELERYGRVAELSARLGD